MDALRAQARALARSLYHYDFLHAQQAEASPALARGGLARRLACVEEQDEGKMRQVARTLSSKKRKRKWQRPKHFKH